MTALARAITKAVRFVMAVLCSGDCVDGDARRLHPVSGLARACGPWGWCEAQVVVSCRPRATSVIVVANHPS
jgi:hypothetical protein